MQSVNSFIKLLGKNYYSDFITDINAETLDFDNYYVLVKYQNSFFYELSNGEINKKRNEIFTKIKESYQEALTEIYAIILSHDSSKMNTYLDLNASAVKSHLITIKKDFYIDDEQSRYFSIIEDNPVVSDLESMYRKNVKNSEIALDKNVYNLINTSKHQNAESLYYLEYLYERNILLSFIPFSLFAIGKLFIAQLEKIKSKINPEILVNKNNTNAKLKTQKKYPKEETYFESFLKHLNNESILKKHTAIGLMVDFKRFIKEIKSEILDDLQTKRENRNDYLDYLINEIEKQHYVKSVNISFVQKWLDEYKISIEEIFEMNYRDNPIEAIIDRHYMDMDKYSEEKDKAHLLQSDFRDYFCKYYADELITFIKTKKGNNNIVAEQDSVSNQYPRTENKIAEIHSIFKSPEAFDTFNMLLEKFDISSDKIKKRGVQAQLNAIWGCPKSKKEIFKEHAELKEYVNFLNEEYKSTFNSRTMSDGSKYHTSIKEWLN